MFCNCKELYAQSDRWRVAPIYQLLDTLAMLAREAAVARHDICNGWRCRSSIFYLHEEVL